METFVVKLAVAIIPLVALIVGVILPDLHCRRKAFATCQGRRTRREILRACAVGIMLR